MAASCRAAGRDVAGVTLLVASKYATDDQLLELARAGQRVFGENRVQDAFERMEMAEAAGFDLEWHFIGHLQTNKARQVVGRFALIHSIDSRHVAEAVSRRAVYDEATVDVLLQVNVDEDPAKQGFRPEEILTGYPEVVAMAGITVRGLMTIGRLAEAPDAARPTFAHLRTLRQDLDALGVAPPLRDLSMGMSHDYQVAIEEGATIVRVGSAIFAGVPGEGSDR